MEKKVIRVKIVPILLIVIISTLVATTVYHWCSVACKKSEIERTCRSMVESYLADKAAYEKYLGANSITAMKWALTAKDKANTTAKIYNEYILDNGYVWDGDIPADLEPSLDLID